VLIILDLFARGVSPETFQFVKLPLLSQEDMNDEVYIVHQDPMVMIISFHMPWHLSRLFFQLHAHRFNDGADLQIRIACDQDENISYATDPGDIQNQYILPLLFKNGIYSKA